MEQYSSDDARKEWRRILNEVERGQPVGVTRYGKPLAVIVSAEWYEQAKALTDRRPWGQSRSDMSTELEQQEAGENRGAE